MSSRILETAVLLARSGMAVHWLHPRSKVPLLPGYQLRPWTAPDVLLRQWYQFGPRPGCGELNLGLHTGRVAGAACPVVALDLDSLPARDWADAHIPLSPVRNLSPKGEHRLYRHPAGVVVRNRVKVRVHGQRIDLDLRGDGGNLAIAPSIHPSGVPYVAAVPWKPDVLAAMPLWDPAWIPSEPEPPVSVTRSCARDEPSLLQRGRRLAEEWQVSERGHGQGTDTFKLAGYLIHTIGLSEQAAFEVMWEHYNPRCREPYTEALLRRKAEQAATQIRSRKSG